MKNKLSIFSYINLLLISVVVFNSCSKQTDLPGTGYGTVHIVSSFAATAPSLLVQVDGVTMDTLTSKRASKDVLAKAGDRNIKLVKENGEVVVDTVLSLEMGKVVALPRFLYDGSALLFDDLDSKPDRDSLLVRFVNLDPTLPDVLDFEIRLVDFDVTNVLVKSVKGVRKDRFSEFVQLPNPEITMPGTFMVYIVEATNPATGEKVMSFNDGNFALLMFFGAFYFPNAVSSIGIKPPSPGSLEKQIENIFERVVQ